MSRNGKYWFWIFMFSLYIGLKKMFGFPNDVESDIQFLIGTVIGICLILWINSCRRGWFY